MSSVLLFNKDDFLALIKYNFFCKAQVASFAFVAVGRGGSYNTLIICAIDVVVFE